MCEHARETGEFCLAGTCAPVSEEPCQPAWPGFSPVTRDYPGTFNGNLSTAAARSVLSMNWEQSSRFHFSYNDLICTACSPNRACGKCVNNANQPVKSSDSQFLNVNYSPLFSVKNTCGEQVLFWTFGKNHITAFNFCFKHEFLISLGP
jgi:hypothetical protein